jgi:hypothetical protein
MEHPRAYSHGLLYSISSQDLPSLHLQDDERNDEFDWNTHESRKPRNTISQVLVALLKKTAAHWGIRRH